MSERRGTSVEELKKMLESEDFSKPADFMNYPIHEIAKVRRDLVDFAVARGAKVNVRNDRGIAPLDIAIARNNPEIVASLLRNGAAIDHLDPDGRPPLLAAVDLWPDGVPIVEMLLKAGADPDLKARSGQTARQLASDFKHPSFEDLK